MAGSGDRRPPLDEPVGIAISGDDASVWWEPACAGVARRYRIEGGLSPSRRRTPRKRYALSAYLYASATLDEADAIARPLAMEDGYK